MSEIKRKEKSIVESFFGKMPIIGDFVNELAKTETFQKRFKKVDEKIKENLRKREKRKLSVEADISIKPIIEDKEDVSEIAIEEDYIYGRKGDKLNLIVAVPKEDAKLEIKSKKLIITSDDFEKNINLPSYFKSVKKKDYRRGVLILELTK